MSPVTRRKGSSMPKECHSWPLEQAPWSKSNQALVTKGHALGSFEPWASSPKPHKTGIKLIYIATHFPQVPETTSWQLGI